MYLLGTSAPLRFGMIWRQRMLDFDRLNPKKDITTAGDADGERLLFECIINPKCRYTTHLMSLKALCHFERFHKEPPLCWTRLF